MATILSRQVQIRVKPQQLAFWRAAAAALGMTLSELLRQAVDTFARDKLGKDPAGSNR